MKKALGFFISATIALQALPAFAETYYTNEQITPITNGVLHKYIESYTHAGWQNIHVVEADLTAPHVKADILTHKDGLGYAANVLKLAEDADAVAAINGDFFARNSWDKASTVGLVIEDGELVSTQSEEINGATVAFDEAGHALMEYIKTDVVFTASNGNSIKIKEINKYDSLKEPVVYTSAFSEKTGGSYDNILEVVVEDNIVTDMRRNMDGVEVPENGYVIRHLPEYNTFLWENVKVGDAVTLTVKTSVDIESFKSASAGGTLLVKDGKKHTLTHSISGTNPRTMAGINAEGTKLYLITVDGRSGSSAGLTMQGVQDLALELGLYTAINLDGGGSTTMVTRDPKTDTLAVNNTPSDGALRTVPMGIGIFSDAPEGKAETLVIKDEKLKMFPGARYSFEIDYALDSYGNPCAVPEGKVSWDSQDGYFEDGAFIPEKAGNAKITVSIGKAKGELTVSVLDLPERLETVPRSVAKDEAFTVYGIDARGNKAEIPLADCRVKERDGYKYLSFGGAEGAVYMQPENTDTFEEKNGSASVYPAGTTASYALTDEDAVSGTKSGKLSFSFKKNSDTQAAYLMFSKAKSVPDKATHMGVFVYAPYENYQWLRVLGKDKNGETVRLTLKDSMEFSGWKYLTVEVPADLESVTGLYVVQNGKAVAADSYILLDDFSFTDKAYNLPMHSTGIAEQSADGGFKVNVTNEALARDTLYAGLYDAVLKKTLENSEAELHIALGKTVGKEKTTDTFYAFTEDNTAGLVLAVNKSGISGADNGQWAKIREYATHYENLMLFMPTAVESLPNRQDEVLLGILQESGCKNVYIFYPGMMNGITLKDGVHYVTVSGLKYTSGSVLLDQMQYEKYAEVTIKNGKVYIRFRKVYEQE